MTQAHSNIRIWMPFLVSCACCLLTLAHPTAQAADRISGEWRIDANNYHGRLVISGDDGDYHGRVMFEDVRRWEDLTDIRYDPRRHWIEFNRPFAHQHYEGQVIGDDRMEGRFDGGSTWRAVRIGGGDGDVRDDNHDHGGILSGEWRINANNYRGRLEFTREGDHYRGRVFFEDVRQWEPLIHIRFDRERGWIEFDRPNSQQHYEGHLVRDDRMEGTFSGGYHWFAERMH